MLTDWLNEERLECGHPLCLQGRDTPSSPVRERERDKERENEKDREREKEGEREGDVEYGYWIYFIAFNNGNFKRNDGCLGTF